MPQKSPIQFMLKHKKIIIETYGQSDKNYGKTWEALQKTLPELAKAMRINTFKQYMSGFVVFIMELEKVIQERDLVIQILYKTERLKSKLETRVKKLEEGLDNVIQNKNVNDRAIQQLDNPPKRLDGWSVQLAKDGYYRCYRKIANRVYSVYIGKIFDVDKARGKITKKEKQLGLYNS
jgi:hypothetical protein